MPKRVKKRVPKAPLEILALPCADKTGWTESYAKKGTKNLANFIHPARVLCIGPCGTGKSTLAKNLLIQQRPRFKEVYVCHLDAERTKEWKVIEPTMMLSEIPPVDFFDGKVKTLLIIDDFEWTASHKERLKNIAGLFRYASTHCNLSIYLCHQSFFDIPPLCKKMANYFCIWKPTSRLELTQIANRINMNATDLKKLFKHVITGHRDHLTVDLCEGTPAKYRKNIFQPIELNEDDSD